MILKIIVFTKGFMVNAFTSAAADYQVISSSISTMTANFVLGRVLGDKIADVFEEYSPINNSTAKSLIRNSFRLIVGLAATSFKSDYFILVTLVGLAAIEMLKISSKILDEKKDKVREEDSSPSSLTDMVAQAAESPHRSFEGMDSYVESLEIALEGGEIRNAILVGPAGSGKTAIVEDLASRIAHKTIDQNSFFKNKKIFQLDFNRLMSGNRDYQGGLMIGMLETKVKEILEFLEKKPDVVLFIDEIHRIDGAGRGARGRGSDLANLLKERLGRDGITIIGATTQEEYKYHIEKDLALKRRFYKIEVAPPTSNDCIDRINYQIPYFGSKYPGFMLQEEAVKVAVFLVSTHKPTDPLLHESLQLIHHTFTSQKRNANRRARQNQEGDGGNVEQRDSSNLEINPSMIADTCIKMFKMQHLYSVEDLLKDYSSKIENAITCNGAISIISSQKTGE